MSKEFNYARIIIFGGLCLMFDGMIFVGILSELYGYFQGHTIDFDYMNNIGFIVYSVIIILYNNLTYHIILENSTIITESKKGFLYNSILSKEKLINISSVKKIVICKENILYHGRYESILIVRKGMRRTLFISEYTMTKDRYKDMKKIVLNGVSMDIIHHRNYLYKQLALLFVW